MTPRLTPRLTPHRLTLAVAAACCLSSSGYVRAEVLSLHSAWDKAKNNEATWRMAQAEATIEQEDPNKARANMLPQIAYSSSNSNNSVTQTGTTNASTSYGSSSSSLSLRQPLFRMQSYSEYQRATARSEGSQFRLNNEAQALTIRVAQAYFDVLLAEDSIRHTSFLEKSLHTQVDAARKAFLGGSGTRIDIDETRARLAMASADRIAAENNRRNAKKRLSMMIGTPVSELLPLDETLSNKLRLEPSSFEEWFEIARQKSPELAAAVQGVEEASWGITTARAGHLPTLDLVMSRSNAESDTISTVNSKYTSKAIGLQLNVPIFSGGYTTSDTAQATARHQRALAARENAERQLETRLLQEYNGVLQGEERLASLAIAREASLEALRSTRHGVAAGSRTSLDVLNAERQLYANRIDIARARYDWLMSRLRLQALAGKLDETAIKEVSGLLHITAHQEHDETPPASSTSKTETNASPSTPDGQIIARDSIIKTKREFSQRELPLSRAINTASRHKAQAANKPLAHEPATTTASSSPATATATATATAIEPVTQNEVKAAAPVEERPAPAATEIASTSAPTDPAPSSAAAPFASSEANTLVASETNAAKPNSPDAPSLLSKMGAFFSGLFSREATAVTEPAKEDAEPSTLASLENTSLTPLDQPKDQPKESASQSGESAASSPAPQTAVRDIFRTPPLTAPAAQSGTQTRAQTTAQATVQTTTSASKHAHLIPAKASGNFVVALGSYGNPDNVLRILGSTDKIGIRTYTEPLRPGVTRVRAGPFVSRDAAKKALVKLSAAGIAGVVDKR